MASTEPYTPWMRSLLNRMKELYNKPNAKTIAEALPEVGSGGEVTPASIVTATGQMDGTQKATTRNNLGAEAKKFVVTVTKSGGTYSADKTFAQISAALQDKEEVVVKYDRYTMYFAADLGGAYAFTTLLMLENPNDIEYSKRQLIVFSQNNIDTWLEYKELFTPSPSFDTPGSGVVSIEPKNNCAYKCGTLTSLTISNPPAIGAYSIVFTSGATATTTTIPATILGLEDFSAEANTLYEINVLDNRAVVGSWAVSA